jgi:hypothetical protein
MVNRMAKKRHIQSAAENTATQWTLGTFDYSLKKTVLLSPSAIQIA